MCENVYEKNFPKPASISKNLKIYDNCNANDYRMLLNFEEVKKLRDNSC
jgi:hypothetical protein